MKTWTVEPLYQWWVRMMAQESVSVMADQIERLRTAAIAEQQQIRQIEKRLKRHQRWLDRRRGKGYLWS